MLKILNTSQIKGLDAYTIEHEPIPSIELMERACKGFVTWFTEKFDATNKVGVVCGPGNNGGDGLGIARMLSELGYPVKVWIVKGNAQQSIEFTTNLNRLNSKIEVFEITSAADRGLFHDRDIIIDGIFGSGLSRSVEGIFAQVIECINQTKACIIAIDIPSGLLADQHSTGPIVKADYTLSFQLPKLAFLLPQSDEYIGEWLLIDIGLRKDFIKNTESAYRVLQRKDIRKIKKSRSKFDHKGVYGRAMLFCGSYGKIGAAVLAAKAAMRSGPGLLTVHVPKCGYTILQSTVPEAMVSIDSNEEIFTSVPDTVSTNAIGLGPGIGINNATVQAVSQLLDQYQHPMVIDADGLNILSGNIDLQRNLPEGCILTPHAREFERLAGRSDNDFERLEKLKHTSSRLNAIVVLKGAYTAVAAPDGKIYFNSTGNPGMATGGSGDVLTGILTGLLAQGYTSLESALMGVYLHGLAGDMAVHDKGMEALIASDLIDYLPTAFLRIDH